MQIKILSSGADTPLITRTYGFEGCNDRILVAAVRKIRDSLDGGMRINLDQTLLLLTFTVASAIDMKWDMDKTRKTASHLLSHDKVMIGVPEMLNKIDFEVTGNGKVSTISIDAPIAVPNYGLVGPD